tara:strand:+ start:848 stop:1204 length:357 start_codon:yes stop_codon:yes gene_type:complete
MKKEIYDFTENKLGYFKVYLLLDEIKQKNIENPMAVKVDEINDAKCKKAVVVNIFHKDIDKYDKWLKLALMGDWNSADIRKHKNLLLFRYYILLEDEVLDMIEADLEKLKLVEGLNFC